jgi:hypothetical protein
LKLKYWNECKIIKVIDNANAPSLDVSLMVEFLGFKPIFQFEVFASNARNMNYRKTLLFDFNRFPCNKKIFIRIQGNFQMVRPESHKKEGKGFNKYYHEGLITLVNVTGREKHFVMGPVIEEAQEDYMEKRGQVMSANGLYVYFIDNHNETKKGDFVLLSIYGIIDIKKSRA